MVVEGARGMSGGAPLARVGAPPGRRAEYAVVFCEVPPREPAGNRAQPAPGAPAPAKAGALSEGSSAPGGRAHGTYAKAVTEGCTCERCRAARRAYNRRRAQAIARPDETWLPYVSAEPARAHLVRLGRAGVGLKAVARLSGVSNGSLTKIVYGQPAKGRPPSRRIRPQTLARILAVRAPGSGGGRRVESGPTWALVEELVAAGYARAFLARALGSRSVSPRLQLGRDTVRADTAQAVEDLHRRLLGQSPTTPGDRR